MNEEALNARFYSDPMPLFGAAKDNTANEGKSWSMESGMVRGSRPVPNKAPRQWLLKAASSGDGLVISGGAK